MLYKGKIIALLLFLLLVSMNAMVNMDDERLVIENHLVTKLNDGYSIELINQMYGTEILQYLPQLDIYLLRYSGGGDLLTISVTIDAMPEVSFCHPNYVVIPLQSVQTSIPISDNEGSGECSLQRAAIDLGLPDLPTTITGAGVKVAVIDGGVNDLHPHLTGFITSGYDYIDFDDYAFDEPGGPNSGHGTFIAGIVHLVAPEAEIVSYRVTDLIGFSTGYVVAEAILAAVEDGCRVINLSMVMAMDHEALGQAIQYARDHNVMVIAAAGNDDFAYEKYPASHDYTIAVAAVDSLQALADFSCFGTHIDVCAPGTGIYSSYVDTGFAWWGGTSFAAPFVTGQAALLVSADTTLTYQQLFPLITNTATSIDDLNPDYVGLLGSGLIDIASSLANIDCICGDLDYDQSITLADMMTMIDILFSDDELAGDMNYRADVDPFLGVDVGDLTYFTDYMYKAGDPPCIGRSYGDRLPGGLVDVGFVSGLVGPTEVMLDQALTMYVRLENTAGVPFAAISSGFTVYSPDGASIVIDEFTFNDSLLALMTVESPDQGEGYDPDGFGLYICGITSAILPAGFRDVAYTIKLAAFSETDLGKTVCLDTSSYALGGAWKWQTDGLSNHIPQWGGPYCFTIVEPDFNPGDVDYNHSVDIMDLTATVDYLFGSPSEPLENPFAADMNGNCIYGEISDLMKMVNFLFTGGNPPVYGCTNR